VSEVHSIAPGLPLIVAEVGCAEVGGDKAGWVTDFVRWLAEDGRANGFIWFEHDKETDWRMSSSSEAEAAMATVLREVAA
jgi:mannan endo-1,4-beta-mannosidase